MPGDPTKSSKQARGREAIRQGRDPDEIFAWLFDRWCNARMSEADRISLSLQLLPYVKRKLAPVPADEVRKALSDGRLVVMMSDQAV